MTILAAVGEKHRSHDLVRTAYQLAEAYDDDLVVLHVIPQNESEAHFEELRKIHEFEDMPLTVEVGRAEDVARTIYREALADHDRDRVRPEGLVGDPTESILRAADKLDARYVVIGGRKRSPTGKAVFGSVTQSVLLNAEVPTVTVMARS